MRRPGSDFDGEGIYCIAASRSRTMVNSGNGKPMSISCNLVSRVNGIYNSAEQKRCAWMWNSFSKVGYGLMYVYQTSDWIDRLLNRHVQNVSQSSRQVMRCLCATKPFGSYLVLCLEFHELPR
jgi:hypothetical protein